MELDEISSPVLEWVNFMEQSTDTRLELDYCRRVLFTSCSTGGFTYRTSSLRFCISNFGQSMGSHTEVRSVIAVPFFFSEQKEEKINQYVNPSIEEHIDIKAELEDHSTSYAEKIKRIRVTTAKPRKQKKTLKMTDNTRNSKNENIKRLTRSGYLKKTSKVVSNTPKVLENKITRSSQRRTSKFLSRSSSPKKTSKSGKKVSNNKCKNPLKQKKPLSKPVPKSNLSQDGEIIKKTKIIFGRAIYYCHTCNDQILLTRAQLREHFIKHGMPEAVKTWSYYRKARAKRSRASLPSVYPCEICNKYLPNQTELDEHLKKHDDQFFCDICNVGFKLLIEHTYHVQEHSDDKLFQCPLCTFKTNTRGKIKSHLYSLHEQFRKFKCEICGKSYSLFSYLEEHKNFHTGEKPFQCDICGLSFIYTRYLKAHKTKQHSQVSRKRFECSLCQKSFALKKGYDKHMASVHSFETNLICDICGKTFRTRDGLRKHYKLHSDERPYKCKYCDMSFKSSGSKVDHERIHTGVKPHQCPVCGKGFIQRTPMVRHWRNHIERESYSCYTCLKNFSTKLALINHVKGCRRSETL